MIIRQGETKVDEKKLEAIEKWKPPTLVKGIQLFTGFANFYRKFIPDFSNIVAPLNLLTCKGTLGLDSTPTMCFQMSETHLLICPYPTNP